MAITLTQLRGFLAVARTGSVTAAADELVVTQPSVSAAVAALSREIGADLTVRAGRGVRPSAAGAAFAPYAADVIGLLEEGARAAREAAGAAERELRIAAVNTAGEHIVPPLMEAFGALHPDVAMTLDVGNRARVFDLLIGHEVDIAIAGRPAAGGVTGTPFLDNPIVLVTAAADPLARRRRVTLDELADRAWLMREDGSGTRALTEEFLAGHDLRPRTLTLGSNGAIKQAARAGIGVALQSRLAIGLELELGVLATIPLDVPLPRRQWYLLRPPRSRPRAAVEEFVAFARSDEGRRAIGRSAHAEIEGPLPERS